MSRRVLTLLMSGIALTTLTATTAGAQQTRAPALRSTMQPTVAQQPAASDAGTAPLAAPPGDVTLPAADQPSVIGANQPRRASTAVRSSRVRGVTQAQIRAAKPVVGTLPPAIEPAPTLRRRPPAEIDPYAPLGLRLGSITVTPAVTNSVGFDTNPQRAAGAAKGSVFSRHEGEVGVQSDWNVHELKGTLRGGYSEFYQNKEASRPDAEGGFDLRLDASRDTRILFETRVRIDTQRPGSPDLTAAVMGRPLTYSYGASAGVSHDINRLQLTLRGSVDRNDYEDARLSSGAIASQRDRNQSIYGLRLRAGYELTPGLKPFVQSEIDSRQFDKEVDFSGYRRSSGGLTGRVGSTFELSRLITGEASVGYQDRNYDDTRLQNLRGLIGDVAVLWTPTPLTTVTLRGASELGDTTIPGSSGTSARRVNLEIAHALRRNLIVTGFGSLGRTTYDGQGLREDFTTVGARVEYRLTRTFAVRASFTHERLNSSSPGSDYTANISQVGLRLQF